MIGGCQTQAELSNDTTRAGMDHILRVSQDWYNHRRGHTARDHLPPLRGDRPDPGVGLITQKIVCHSELGGHLKSYRQAA